MFGWKNYFWVLGFEYIKLQKLGFIGLSLSINPNKIFRCESMHLSNRKNEEVLVVIQMKYSIHDSLNMNRFEAYRENFSMFNEKI